jgi:hypothetical protein
MNSTIQESLNPKPAAKKRKGIKKNEAAVHASCS